MDGLANVKMEQKYFDYEKNKVYIAIAILPSMFIKSILFRL